ncbi:MAG: TlpA family protein disulfide reductase [Bdellovibrio sp.]|nr:TlpA family protein disulfide reductase [Bdellovibrio sp.]
MRLTFLFITLLLTISAHAKDAATTPPANIEIKSLPSKHLQGEKLKGLGDLKGKVVLIDFWASWCEPCKEALPIYNNLYKKYKDQGLVIIGINEDNDEKDRDTFLKTTPLDFPMYQDEKSQWVSQFKIQALPTLFVFDKNLKPISMYRGFSPEKATSLEKQIKDLLSKK